MGYMSPLVWYPFSGYSTALLACFTGIHVFQVIDKETFRVYSITDNDKDYQYQLCKG